MRLLMLGSGVRRLLPTTGELSAAFTEDPISYEALEVHRPDWLISFGYRHIVPDSIIEAIEGRAVNLHISLLPWNRGADPNLWSWLEDTPRGVSIHWMTAGLDRGDLIAQRSVELSPRLTLRQSYETLMHNIVDLFGGVLPQIRSGCVNREVQPSGGSYHRSSDKDSHTGAMPLGWDTPCEYVRDYGRLVGLSATSAGN